MPTTASTCKEFMIAPHRRRQLCRNDAHGAETYQSLEGHRLKKRGLTTAVGDEGGLTPNVGNLEGAGASAASIDHVGLRRAGPTWALALDAAASEFYEDGSCVFKKV